MHCIKHTNKLCDKPLNPNILSLSGSTLLQLMNEESLLTFPCEFPIKVMGRSSDTFESDVVEIVRKYVPDLPDSAVTSRPSGKGNYIAITVLVTATSKEQLDNIYLELNAQKSVLMTL